MSEALTPRDGIMLIPYSEVNGARSVSDSSIAHLFCELDNDGVIAAVFNDHLRTEAEFLAFMKDPANLPVFVVVDGELTAACWLNGIARNHAFAHFVAVKRCWGKQSAEMGARAIEYWFSFPGNNGPLLDVLIGKTPANNRLAIRHVEKLGFVTIGEVPYMADGDAMSISYRVR